VSEVFDSTCYSTRKAPLQHRGVAMSAARCWRDERPQRGSSGVKERGDGDVLDGFGGVKRRRLIEAIIERISRP